MRLTEFMATVVAASACVPADAAAQASAELLDLAGRVHYGYYQADPRAIEAALAGLDRLGDSPKGLYYRDYAALRLAQLGIRDRGATQRLRDCATRDAATGLAGRAAAEAWVLAGACALLLGDERRLLLTLARARVHDDDHPRIALVEAWRLERNGTRDTPALAEKLAAAVAAFDAWQPSIDDPEWGHAEALTALAASTLARGDIRAARDLLERALLVVPDYRRAVELRTAMQGARGGSRTL